MKNRYWVIALFAASCATNANAADFAAFGPRLDQRDAAPSITLYVSKSFGGKARGKDYASRLEGASGLRFGIAIERGALGLGHLNSAYAAFGQPIDLAPARPARLLNLQFNTTGRGSLRLNGVRMHSFDDSYGSYGEDSWSNPWLWFGVAVGALSISCATDHWPCASGRDSSPSSDYVIPTG